MDVFLIIYNGLPHGGGKLDIRAYRERDEAEKKYQELRQQIRDESIFHNEDRLVLIERHVTGSDGSPQTLLDRAKVRLLLKIDCSLVTADADPNLAVQAFLIKSNAQGNVSSDSDRIITVNPWPIMAYAVVTTVNGMFSNLNGYVTRQAAYKDCDNMQKHSAGNTANIYHEVYQLALNEQPFHPNA